MSELDGHGCSAPVGACLFVGYDSEWLELNKIHQIIEPKVEVCSGSRLALVGEARSPTGCRHEGRLPEVG